MKNLFNKISTAILSYSLIFISFILLFIFLDFDLVMKLKDVSANQIGNLDNFRTILIDFLETGQFNLFTWDVFLGTDRYLNYLYLMLGDVLSYLSVLVPSSRLSSFYIILIFVRLFLVGISFIIYSKNSKITNSSCVVGALLYTFSSYSLYLFQSNPYILNMMILIPILLIGIERLIIDNKKGFFILISSFILLTNFYYLPFILLLILFYSTILIFNKYFIYGFKVVLEAYLRVILSLIVSFLLSALGLIPFIFYHYNYILDFNNYFDISLLGLNGLFLVYLPLSFRKIKENRNYIILMMIMFLLVVIFNNSNYFSIFNNNFSFILCFLSSFIIAKTMDLYSNISRIDFKWIVSFIFIILLFIYLFNIEISETLMFTLITGIGFLVIILNKKELNHKFNIFGFVFYIFLLGSIFISTFRYLNNNINYSDVVSNRLDKVLLEIEDDSFYRLVVDNSSNIKVDNYNYLNNEYYSLDSDLNILSLNDFNNRTRLLSLIGEKYYISDNGDLYVPKKHKLLFEKDGYSVFENKYYIGITSFYDSYVPSNIYDEFNSLEKESSLLKSVVLDDKDINNQYIKQNFMIRDEVKKDIISVNSSVREEEKKLYVLVDSINNNGELYLEINDFQSDGGVISFEFRDRIYHKEVAKEEDLLINFTSFGSFDEEIVIDLSNLENYSYSSIKTYIANFDSYVSNVEKLKSSNFEVIEYQDGYIKGKVDVSNKGVLQFATAYSKNWDVLIDGKKTDTYLVNNYFLGTYLDEGIHEIELVYNLKYLSLSYVLFGVGLVLFCGILIIETRKNGVNHEKRKKRS